MQNTKTKFNEERTANTALELSPVTKKPSKVNIKLITRGLTCFPSLEYRCLTAEHLSLLIQNSLNRNSTGSP